MNNIRAAAQVLLDTFDACRLSEEGEQQFEALRAALAEPGAEPIGLLTIDKEARTFKLAQYEAFGDLNSGDYEIYTTQPPKPAPEPDKQCHLGGQCKHGDWCTEVYCQEHCQFVKAKPAPEPVMEVEVENGVVVRESYVPPGTFSDGRHKLYTAPQPAEWQELTPDKVAVEAAKAGFSPMLVATDRGAFTRLYNAISAALKAKNGGAA